MSLPVDKALYLLQATNQSGTQVLIKSFLTLPSDPLEPPSNNKLSSLAPTVRGLPPFTFR